LYLTYVNADSDSDWQRELSEEYSNSTNFSDGEIYRKIRQYSSDGSDSNYFAEKKWWARLTKKKRNFLKRLLKHKGFRKAFDALRGIPGIWPGLNIGVLDKIIAMKCDEVSNKSISYVTLLLTFSRKSYTILSIFGKYCYIFLRIKKI
jgi:hypothetical protein